MGGDGNEKLPDLSTEGKNKEEKNAEEQKKALEEEQKKALEEKQKEMKDLQIEIKEKIVTVEKTYDTAKADINIKENISIEDGKKIKTANINISTGADTRTMDIPKAKEIFNSKIKILQNETIKKFTNPKNKEEIQKIIDNLSDENIKKIKDNGITSKNQNGNRFLIAARIAEGFIKSLDTLAPEKPENEPTLSLHIDWDNCIIGKLGEGDKEDNRFLTMKISLTVEKNEVDDLVSKDDKNIEDDEFTIQKKIQKYTIVGLPDKRERYHDKDSEESVGIFATPTPGRYFNLGLAKNDSPKYQINAYLNFGQSGDLTTKEITIDNIIYTVTLDNGTLKFTEKPTGTPQDGAQKESGSTNQFIEMNGSTQTQQEITPKEKEAKKSQANNQKTSNLPKEKQQEFNDIDESKKIQLKSTEEIKKETTSKVEEPQIPLKNTTGEGEQIDNLADQIRAENNVEQNRIDAKNNIIKMSGNIDENKRIIEALIINPDIYSKEVEIVTGNYVLTITDKTDTKNIAKIQINQQGKILTPQITMNGKEYTVTLTDTGIKIEEIINQKKEDIIPINISESIIEQEVKKPAIPTTSEKIEKSDEFTPIIIPPLEDIKEPIKEVKKESKDTKPPVEVQKENTIFTLENLQNNLPKIKNEKNEQGEELNYQTIFDRINSIKNQEVKNEIEKRLLAGDIRGVQIYIGMKTDSQYDDNRADGIFDWRTLDRLTLFGLELKNNSKIPQDVKEAYTILHPDSGFAIVSKTDNNMYVFSPDRHLISIHHVILGKQIGNTPNEAYNNKNKTTPKGKYRVDKHVFKKNDFSTTGEYVALLPLEGQYDINNSLKFTLGFHIRPKGVNKREAELKNKNGNRRMSNGCINTLSEGSMYDNLPTGSMFYVTDEPQ